MNPDRLAELEEELRFLLRSIGDLDRERAAGDVDEADFQALHDGYTARAAGVLRAVDEGRSALPPKRPRNWKRTIAIVAVVAVIGVVAGILVARGSGQRDPGETITGGTSPNQVASLLAEGRSLLFAGQYGEASKHYLDVLDIDPSNVEALTYAGWVLAVSSQAQTGATATGLLNQSKQFLDNAVKIDPTYADSHCFLAVIAVLFEDDAAAGEANRTDCLANNPSADMRDLVDDTFGGATSSDTPGSTPGSTQGSTLPPVTSG